MDWRDEKRAEEWRGGHGPDRALQPESVAIIVIVLLVFIAPFLRLIL